MPIRISTRVRHLSLLLLFVALLAVLGACTPGHTQSTFGSAGPVASRQKDLFVLIFWVAAVVFVVVEVAIIAVSLLYRKRPAESVAHGMHGNTRLEIAWTIAPAVILAVIAIPTVNMIFSLDREATEAAANLQIDVTGHQWWWEIEYPGEDVVTANEVHIPSGEPVEVLLSSADVIHSFWVPKLAGKVDAIPTRTNHLVIQADEPGTYYGQCAEFCGEDHALMRFRVIAQAPDEFEAWLESMRRPPEPPVAGSPAAAGQTLFVANCSMCHSTQTYVPALARGEHAEQEARQQQFLDDPEDAVVIAAPNLTGLASRTTLAAGLVDLNEENLTKWLHDPNSIKPGNRMQKLANVFRSGGLKDEQVSQLVAYLMTLKPGPESAPTRPSGPTTGDPVARGMEVFNTVGCSGCHSTGSNTIIGPGLAGLADRAATREPGMSADDYIHESIVNPTAYVVEPFYPLMPTNFGQTLSEDDISAVIAYLKTLQ